MPKSDQLALNSLLRYSCKLKCGETVVNFGGVKVEENIEEKEKKIKNKRKQRNYMCVDSIVSV